MGATTNRLMVLEVAGAAEVATEMMMTMTTATTATSAIMASTPLVDHVHDTSTSAATKGEQGPGC